MSKKTMKNTFPHRRLGKSDLLVSPIGLGCSQFSRGKGMGRLSWPDLPENEIGDIINTSLESGINWFDTAESYGWGKSEQVLTESLKKAGRNAGEVTIATKWSPFFRTARSILKTIDKRLECLNGFGIDLYQIHHPLSVSSIKNQMLAMAKLVMDNKIRYVGVSNFSAVGIRKAHEELSKYGMKLISNQVRFNLMDRKIETNGVLETAQELGISIIAYSPLAMGLLTGKFHDNPELIKSTYGLRKYLPVFKPKGLEKSRPVINVLKELADKYNVSPTQIAINWVINVHGDTIVAIPGATKRKHAEDIANTMKFKLTNDELDYLAKI